MAFLKEPEITLQKESNPFCASFLKACRKLGLSSSNEEILLNLASKAEKTTEKILLMTNKSKIPSELLTTTQANPEINDVLVYFNYREQLASDGPVPIYLGVVRKKPGDDIYCECCQIGEIKSQYFNLNSKYKLFIANKETDPEITGFYLDKKNKPSLLKLSL